MAELTPLMRTRLAAIESGRRVEHLHATVNCRNCGYQLQEQPVRIDPQTQLAVVCCPECGQVREAPDRMGVHPLDALGSPQVKSTQQAPGTAWMVGATAMFVMFCFVLTLAGQPSWEGVVVAIMVSAAGALLNFLYFLAMAGIEGKSATSLAGAALMQWLVVMAPVVLVVGLSLAIGYDVDGGAVVLAVLATSFVTLGGSAPVVAGGRPLGRQVVNLLVPPRKRVLFASFWAFDDLPGPRVDAALEAAAARDDVAQAQRHKGTT